MTFIWKEKEKEKQKQKKIIIIILPSFSILIWYSLTHIATFTPLNLDKKLAFRSSAQAIPAPCQEKKIWDNSFLQKYPKKNSAHSISPVLR